MSWPERLAAESEEHDLARRLAVQACENAVVAYGKASATWRPQEPPSWAKEKACLLKACAEGS